MLYVFYAIITHEELSESVMGGSPHIGAYLFDLMHDKNVPIRAVCDRALSIIAVSFRILEIHISSTECLIAKVKENLLTLGLFCCY